MRSGLRGVSRNVLLLGLVSLFGDISSEMVVPLLPAFLIALGGGAEALGIIEGVAEATASLFKYLSGRWADRVRRLLPMAVGGDPPPSLVRPPRPIRRAPRPVFALPLVGRGAAGGRFCFCRRRGAAAAPRGNLRLHAGQLDRRAVVAARARARHRDRAPTGAVDGPPRGPRCDVVAAGAPGGSPGAPRGARRGMG